MREPNRSLLVITTCFLTLITCALPVDAKEGPTGALVASSDAQRRISVDFHEADIRTVIRAMAERTGRNFIIDEKVKGKVTIISPGLVTKEEALKVFESTLEVYGYTMVEAGAVIKVIPANEARQRAGYGRDAKGDGDKMVTKLIALRHVKAMDIVNALRPLIPPTSYMTAYQETNTLIIADYAANVNKITRLVRQLDSPTHEETISVVQLQYAGAKELATRLDKIYAGGSGGGRVTTPASPKGKAAPGRSFSAAGGVAPKIIPDDRINSLIVMASKSVTEQILALVAQLDVPPPPGRGGINVYYLKNADADNVAKVLNNITGSGGRRRGGKVKAPQNSPKLQSAITITPDKPTNSLVITASVEDYETLREVIQKLDIRRRQVFVEAVIMDIVTSRATEFGVEWRTTHQPTEGGVQAIGGTDFGNINVVAQNPFDAPSGLTVGVVDGIISFGGKDFLNLGALVHALASDTDVNILSTPNIMTTDNEEAKIVVAQNVPFKTATSQTTGGNVVTTIQRQDIGLTLRIKPQISESDDVKLSVYQEISSISSVQIAKAEDLITNTRSIETTVIVRDGQNVVLGGLIREDLNDGESKVPFLGDIPLLGWAFKSAKKKKEKTNLLVFLTPHIVRDNRDMKRVTNARNRSFDKGGSVSDELKKEKAQEEEERRTAEEETSRLADEQTERTNGADGNKEESEAVTPAEEPAK